MRTRAKISRFSIQELLVSSLAQSDALAKLQIEKGIITQQEFLQKISEERATYQKLLNPMRQSVTSSFLLWAWFETLKRSVVRPADGIRLIDTFSAVC